MRRSAPLLISACTQTDPLLENRKNSVGAWKNQQSELIIKASGEVLYSHKRSAAHHRAREASGGSITDHAQELLGDLVFVELPEVGNTLSAEQEAAVVESVKAASDVYAPIAVR